VQSRGAFLFQSGGTSAARSETLSEAVTVSSVGVFESAGDPVAGAAVVLVAAMTVLSFDTTAAASVPSVEVGPRFAAMVNPSSNITQCTARDKISYSKQMKCRLVQTEPSCSERALS